VNNCFIAKNIATGGHVTLCSLLTLTGISLKQNRDHWVQSIGFFKDKCHEELPTINDPVIAIKAAELEAEVESARRSDNTNKLSVQ